MNKIFKLIWLLIVIIGCNRNEDTKPKEEMDHHDTIFVETEYQYDLNYPEENIYNINPTAYFGDTINYLVKFKSNTQINYIKIYYLTEVGEKFEIFPDINGEFMPDVTMNSNEDSFSCKYPLDFDRFSFIFNDYHIVKHQNTSFVFDYHDSIKVIKSDTLKPILISNFEIENHQRLYNIAQKDDRYVRGFNYNSSQLQGKSFGYHPVCGGPCLSADDSSLFIVNIPNDDYDVENDIAITKEFINGWYAPKDNHLFSKIENSSVTFNNVATTWELIKLFKTSTSKTSRVDNPQVGDLYSFRYFNTWEHISGSIDRLSDDWGDIYGLIEITHIEDDELTSDNGGQELDYLEFRLKSFNMIKRFN